MAEKGVYQPTTEMDVEEGSGHPDKDAADRGNWSRKLDFVLSCLSYAVGLGNVWRFPYVCFRNGGGAFLIPFIIMLFVTGIPLVFMELSFGQFASQGIVTVWRASPIFQGVGWAMFIVSVLIAIYYNMIIAWTLYYLFASLTSQLPWSFCGPWSDDDCLEDRQRITNCSAHNGTWHNETCFTPGNPLFLQVLNLTNETGGVHNFRSPSDQYFHKEVLQITEGIHDMGGLKWQLALCLLLAWVLVAICLAKGIKTSGKAVYFTAFFPYIVLTILLVRGLTLEGSADGIIYYLTPEWSRLASAKVWGDAAVQIFFSLSPCWGGLITLSSYNKFSNNCLLDAVLVSILDCVTSVFAGLVIFSIIGYMANELGQDISKVASEGAGLAFVVYPEVVTKLPISQLWAVLFFAMLITLGLGTQIATVTTVHTTLLDRFHSTFRHGWGSQILLLIIAVVCYVIGLAFCTQGGMFVLQLFDNYAATYSLLFIGLVECVGLSWVYGADRFLTDIETMLGKRPHKIWAISWKFIAPIALFAILVFTWVDFKPTTYDNFVFPGWADALGWVISFSSILAIPVVAVFTVVSEMRQRDCSLKQAVVNLSKPSPDWGPALAENRALRMKMDNVNLDTFESQVPLTGYKVNPKSNGDSVTQC